METTTMTTRTRGMNYEDAVDAVVTRAEALAEVRRHADCRENRELACADFLREVGDRTEYVGAEVLGWLGY